MWLGVLTVVAGALPALIAFLGKYIVDAVVAASGGGGDVGRVLELVALEGAAVAALALATRAQSLSTTIAARAAGFPASIQ